MGPYRHFRDDIATVKHTSTLAARQETSSSSEKEIYESCP